MPELSEPHAPAVSRRLVGALYNPWAQPFFSRYERRVTPHAPMGRAERRELAGGALAAMGDAALEAALSAAVPLGAGIGGTVGALEVAGVPVFVKGVPLTDLERANDRSTANLFELPLAFHYGLSSAGFGAWRELAAHEAATGWVLAGACAGFPLLFHARVLPRAPAVSADTGRRAAAWGAPEIRRRFEAIDRATSQLVLFLERFPRSAGADAPGLLAVTDFLGAQGMVHFDAHLGNVLTDGASVFLTDFGQALSRDFALAPAEVAFLERHRDYDRSFVVTKAGRGYDGVRALMNGFFDDLRANRLTAAYPAEALAEAWAVAAGGDRLR